ncbi:hypothetical protein JEQ12_002243 [Ovis aries]|uniref:Multidrug resistance-associated protein 4-like n=1 Tax=Ovis aries TaxID=9940 RepID=A0A836AA67_SHEEP|nr:hypothetical protein JEQ12_002243 [Ovis aries]
MRLGMNDEACWKVDENFYDFLEDKAVDAGCEHEIFRVLLPTYFEDLLTYFQKFDPSDSGALFKAYGYTAVMNVCLVIWAILVHFFFYYVQRIGMRLRVAMCHMIYCKSLRLNNSAIRKTTTGQIVNLLSNDVNRFDKVVTFLHILWIGPLMAITVIILIWMEIGISSFAGMALLIIFMLLQSFFGKLFLSLRKEISKILRSSYLDGMNLIFFDTASKVILFVTFTTYVLLGNMITVSQVFLAVTLYQAVKFTGILLFPMAIESVAETIASVQRIKNFLLLDELPQCDHQLPSDGKTIVNMQDFTSFWDKELRTPTLQGLSFTVRPGELLAVVGPVGAGKSSLLGALLGELPPSQGKVSMHGRIAYVSQQPWVLSGTVRSNILFGKKYEKKRYMKVIKACALEKDLQFLENGDLTVVGDRGTTLSGGQKARISLARAVYQDADIYLLDDLLSAVDAEVSRHLFEQCICQVLHEKITILVTHQWQYLKDASQILLLEKGEMVHKGTYAELLKSGVDSASLLKRENEEAEPSPVPESPTMRTQTSSESSVQSQQSSTPLLKDAAAEDQDTENIQDTLSEERRLEGKVGFKTYKNYFRAGAHWSVIIFLILVNIAAQVAYILQDWWLLNWANEQHSLNIMAYEKGNITEMLDLNWYLGIFSGRILNCFSKDIGHMDDLLPVSFQEFIQMISVERVIEYTQLEQEAPWELEFRPPPDWPNNGMIALSKVNFKYSSDGPLVLKDLTTDIKPGEKVGIVGRTGAGKSSFIAALFRLSEPEGRIWIDKILITEIGLHDLRKKMSIIPQDPIVFTGTMRENLDPFNKHTDEELWNVLEEVQLKEVIEELPDKMDTELVEFGSNLSVGQKQLVCLARAILRKNQILIIDEATAHVDPSTDELIQKKIREKFAQCTVLTIAHRLSTIIDSDRIMVFDSGRLEEYDEPYVLLQNRDSLFYKMVQQLGKAKAAALTETAKQMKSSTFHFSQGGKLLSIIELAEELAASEFNSWCTSEGNIQMMLSDHVVMNASNGQILINSF